MNIVLASSSPRRRQLMEMLEVRNLLVIPSRAEETVKAGLGPAETVCVLSGKKARETARRAPADALVIGADTVVALDGKILGKPRDREQAVWMLTQLSGREHQVFTGVTVLGGGREITEYERTAVRFRELTRQEILDYVKTGEPMDKAGAYGIQGKGSLLVEGIQGDYFNVMGLPLCRLALILKKLGVELL